ncbi:MAG: hypothetical protein P1T08_05905 [Acidimicrobiia bacterium]|nr:hypothetical protein [Acidimicrobiia bacterium]
MDSRPDEDARPDEEGVGCRQAVMATVVFIAFALAMLVVALLIGLDQQLAYPFLFAGGPVTGLVTSIGGDLAFSWPLDLTVWTVLGFFVARYAEQPNKYRFAIGAVIMAALVLGTAAGLMIEPT